MKICDICKKPLKELNKTTDGLSIYSILQILEKPQNIIRFQIDLCPLCENAVIKTLEKYDKNP